MAEISDDIVEITDENGETYKVRVVDIITFEDKEYAILESLSDKNKDEDDGEFILMKVINEDDDYSFETIEDDEEFEKVASYIDELADEIDD